MRIIPAIDIIDGKCVRLTQGDYNQKTIYKENPLDVALDFENAGLTHLHLVDLDGAKAGKVINWKVIDDLKTNTKLIIDFGGGIKTDDEIKRLFDTGINQVNLGSIAVKDKTKVFSWIERFGADRIILSADVKEEFVAIHGWQEKSALNIFDLITEFSAHGLLHITCTDISTDGTLKGPNIELYKRLTTAFPDKQFVASGGVGTIKDLVELKTTGVKGVIVGKAIYEGKVTLKELTSLN